MATDAVSSQTAAAGNPTSYENDHRGNRTEVDAPDTDKPGENTGDYPNITSYAYTTQGQLESVTGGQAYPRDYTYDYAGRMKTMTTHGTEAFKYATGTPGTLDFTRTLDRHQNDLLRPSGWTLGTENAVSYGYDTAGRLQYVHPAAALPAAPAFEYGYKSGSFGLVATVAGPAHTVTNAWEANRDVLIGKENKDRTAPNPKLISKYDYSVAGATTLGANAVGQRTNLVTTGLGFDSDPAGGILTDPAATGPAYAWAYNARGELQSATDPGTPADNRAYTYDAIGNRLTSADATGTTNYYDAPGTGHTAGANALNQYGEIDYPGTDPTAAPLHDADGNMKSGPLHAVAADGTPALYTGTLTWNAENRLVKVKNGTNTVAEFAYDYMGRRISKTVTPTTGDPVTTRFLYDGWNLIAEYAGTTLEKTYTWGMDLSGTMQGAGGGLLAVFEHSFTTATPPVHTVVTYYPTFDGNGNVSEYLDDSGDVQAHYEYDPFGNLTVEPDPAATGFIDFAHKFSTKYHDAETGLYYYGYRYMDPATGRWMSRDPIGERGGVNLYGFVGNDGVNRLDLFGLIHLDEWQYRPLPSPSPPPHPRCCAPN